MRSSTLVSAFLVAGAMSSPVHQKLHNKRVIVYDVVTDVVIEYMTENGADPTSVVAANDYINNYASTTPVAAPVPINTVTPVAVAPPTTSVAAAQAQTTAASSSDDAGAGNGPIPSTLDADSTLYQDIALVHHNVHRANHSASAVTWNATLAEYAKEQAMTCVYSETL